MTTRFLVATVPSSMELFIFFVFLVTAAVLLALWEIQIEGSNGWAAQLPTWRLSNRFTRLLMGGRPLTGYHTFLTLFLLLLLHGPLLFLDWSGQVEAKIIGLYLVLITVEDWLWFVFNPAWGLRKFKESKALWWHPRWVLGLPNFYWVSLPLGILAILWGFGIIG